MKAVIVCGLLSISLAVVSSLECYNCLGCNDKFQSGNNYPTINCDGGSCTKGKAKVGKVHVVARNCSLVKASNGCSDQDIYGIDTTLCVCDSNLCNGSPLSTTSPKMPLFLAAAVTMLKTFLF